jgi:2-polyprenyl-3-methyl-5-hydroxy-6-metoxy-1,4-benzoquinol methylase
MADHSNEVYYSHVRNEIAQLLPDRVGRVLEIGCGRGETLAWIKSTKGAAFSCGVELFAESANHAAQKLDRVLTGNFEAMELPSDMKEFDVILCLDVLEHFVDPWKAIQRLDALLRPGGVLIASIPNVRYFRVALALLLQGRWDYQDSGILDRTHLRFFTRRTALELLQSSGLRLEAIFSTGLEKGRKIRYVNAMTLSLLRPLFEYQYLIKVQKAAP